MLHPSLPPFDFVPEPYAGPSLEEVHRLRQEYLNPAIFHYYKKPLMIVQGRMQYLFDETGRRYLDGFGGIVTVAPGKGGLGTFSPRLDAAGNSVRGRLVTRRLSERLGLNIFTSEPVPRHVDT